MDWNDLYRRYWSLYGLAQHEAAHAVAHILTSRPFARVTIAREVIAPDVIVDGHVSYLPDQDRPNPARGTPRRIVSSWLFIGLAPRAVLSESLPGMQRSSNPSFEPWREAALDSLRERDDDLDKVRQWCELCSGDFTPEGLFGCAWQTTLSWFSDWKHRVPVEMLANELLRQRTLMADEVQTIALRSGCGQMRVPCLRSLREIWLPDHYRDS